MKIDVLIDLYPRVFHMAEEGSWESIKVRGLLSTSAALDLVNCTGKQRTALESTYRDKSVVLQDGTNRIVLRDQKPMPEARLIRALRGGITPRQWYEKINGMTFFWAKEERLMRLLDAREYRGRVHEVLTIDTKSLLRAHSQRAWLCHMNSGNTFPMPHYRDLGVFHRIPDYPTNARDRPLKEIAELTIDYAVPDIVKHTLSVRRMRGAEVVEVIA